MTSTSSSSSSNYDTETNPFAYSKSNNYFAKTFRQINESIELTEKDIKTLSIFAILRIIDLSLTYIFYNKWNAYHLIRFIDYIALFSSFIVTSAIFLHKENIKQRSAMLGIFFNFVFICFDITSFIFYFVFEVKTVILLISLIVNEIWMLYTCLLLIKIFAALVKIAKNNKKVGFKKSNYGNSSYLRKNY